MRSECAYCAGFLRGVVFEDRLPGRNRSWEYNEVPRSGRQQAAQRTCAARERTLITPRLFVCSGATVAAGAPGAKGRHLVKLDSVGSKANVNIRFENVAKIFRHDLSTRLVDFLEIASYVFSADCATRRGTDWTDDDSTEPWGRDFAFVIAVREPDFWRTPKIKDLIEEVLGFLSNDKYSFTFVPLERGRADQQPYFEFGDLRNWPFHRPERVLMFSGGLDSLAGAVETATRGESNTFKVNRPIEVVVLNCWVTDMKATRCASRISMILERIRDKIAASKQVLR